jgi:UDP-glucose 4-epimerase
MRIAVSGANGFVGTALTRQLQRHGHAVTALVRAATQAATADTRCVGNLHSANGLEQALEGAAVVIHLAGRAHVMRERASDSAALYRETNVQGTRRLAEAAAAAGVRRFVFVSSIKVNGERTAKRPFCASDPPAPEDDYGRSKLEAERVLQRIAVDSRLETCIVRPPLIYGPGVKGNFARLMRLVATGVPLPLASIRNRRSLVALHNLCDLLIHCANAPQAIGQTFLISDGEDLSTPDLIRRLAFALARPLRLFPIPPMLLQTGMRFLGRAAAFEKLCGTLQLDVEPTCRQLGWRPPMGVDEALHEAAQWYLAAQQSGH